MSNSLYRTMALDIGDVRIGIAISDLTGTIANGLETYTRKNISYDIDYISSIITTKEVKVVVIGLPINMDGSSGERVEKTHEFANALKQKTTANIAFMDERMTTQIAQRVLIDADVSRAKRKNVIDKLAATIILQDYLDTYKR